MGTLPRMNVKGMSRLIYPFDWNKDIQSYAYEPKNQKEADDIFRTQNRLYKTMRFSVWLGEPEEKKKEEEEPCPKCEEAKKPVKKKRGRPKKVMAA